MITEQHSNVKPSELTGGRVQAFVAEVESVQMTEGISLTLVENISVIDVRGF